MAKTRKPNVGSDPTKGAMVKRWQVGLYAFAIGASLILLLVNVLLIIGGSFSRVLLFAAVVVAGLSWTLVGNATDSKNEPKGMKVTAEPALSAFVQSVAVVVDAPMPDSVHLATAAHLGVIEQTRYFGLKVDSSTLVIGLPFVHGLTQRELAALLAHELAHYTEGDIAHGPRAIRSLQAARDLIAIERSGFIMGIYGSYARKMFRSVGGVGVAQETAADAMAAEAYGTEALRSALDKYDDIAVATDQLLRDYVVPALQGGSHPADMFGGFVHVLESRARADARARDLEKRRDQTPKEFDLHRSPSERLAALEASEDHGGSAPIASGDEPAHLLLDADAKSAEIVVGQWASKLMKNSTSPRSWDQLLDEVYANHSSEIASLAFDADVELNDRFEQALEWSRANDWEAVDAAIAKPRKKTGKAEARRIEWAQCLVTEIVADAGTHTWQHNWDGPAQLVDENGTPFDAAPIAALLVAGKADEASQVLGAATT